MRRRSRIRAAVVCAALLLCTCSVSAWDAPGFSVELPPDWTPVLQGEQDAYSWQSSDAGIELVVNVMENDGVNPFDITEDEVDGMLAPSRTASAQNLEASLQSQGIVCEISEVSSISSKAEWNGQPVLRTDTAYSVYLPETDSAVPLYIRLCLLMSKDHIYGVTYMAADEAALDEADRLGVMEGFTITEDTYDGPTSTIAAWCDVILSVGVTALCAAVAISALAKLRAKKKSNTDENTTERLPPRT